MSNKKYKVEQIYWNSIKLYLYVMMHPPPSKHNILVLKVINITQPIALTGCVFRGEVIPPPKTLQSFSLYPQFDCMRTIYAVSKVRWGPWME